MVQEAHRQEPAAIDDPESIHGHEHTDVRVWGIVLFGVSLVVGAMIIHLLIWGLFAYFRTSTAGAFPRQYPLAPIGMTRLPPAPRLQTKPREELKALRAEEDRVLTGYGWVDQNSGIARVPIDEAIKRVLREGLPSRAEQR